MGLLVEGKWVDRWYETKETGGKFVRQDAKWRDRVTADGKPAEAARAASRQSRAAITSMCRSPAPGRTGP